MSHPVGHLRWISHHLAEFDPEFRETSIVDARRDGS
jgi:hypothetical protein